MRDLDAGHMVNMGHLSELRIYMEDGQGQGEDMFFY